MMSNVRDVDGHPVSPELVVAAYRMGCFPMADHRAGALAWFRPSLRAIITWDRWRVPRSLRKTARRRPYRLTLDVDFNAVIAACAQRSDTWISHDIEALYRELHRCHMAHSVEAWDGSGRLVGGLYGLCTGGVFCGESMFHHSDNASKLCVIALVQRLRQHGFIALDCQQQSDHMKRFGAYSINQDDYQVLLDSCPESRDLGPRGDLNDDPAR